MSGPESGISGWETYYLFFLAGLISLLIPGTLILLAGLLSPARKRPPSGDADVSPRARDIPDLKINTRFHIGMGVGQLAAVAGLVLIPSVELFQAMEKGMEAPLSSVAISIITISLFAGLGLVYAIRKGDMDWVRAEKNEEESGR